jgi:hypothetical protein
MRYALCHDPPPLKVRRPRYRSRGGGAPSLIVAVPSLGLTILNPAKFLLQFDGQLDQVPCRHALSVFARQHAASSDLALEFLFFPIPVHISMTTKGNNGSTGRYKLIGQPRRAVRVIRIAGTFAPV